MTKKIELTDLEIDWLKAEIRKNVYNLEDFDIVKSIMKKLRAYEKDLRFKEDKNEK